MVDKPFRSNLSQWIYDCLVGDEDSRKKSNRLLLATWRSNNAEPLTVLWYALLILAKKYFGDMESTRPTDVARTVASQPSLISVVSIDAVEKVVRVASGEAGLEMPEISSDLMARVCMAICADIVIRGQIGGDELAAVIRRAEDAALAQGILLP